ncbi:MAG: cation-translocating P-type ATPase [Bacteroidota bacterium]
MSTSPVSIAPPKTQHVELSVSGMNCTNCALGIQRYLEKQGMDSVFVDFQTDEVSFETVEPDRVPAMVEGIKSMGYEVHQGEEAGEQVQGFSRLEKLFAFCLLFTIPLILHMFVPWHWLHNPWVQLLLSLPVFIAGMWHFGRSAWKSVQSGVPNMDVLISIGASAAFGYSLYGTLMVLGPDFLFYETAASVITLVLLGNVMEHRAVRQTTTAIRALTKLQESPALRVIEENGQEVFEKISATEVKKNDVLQVNEGDRIPVDGRVLFGEGRVDEAMLSGESDLIHKLAGAEVLGGSLLQTGNLRIQATAVGKQTLLAQIIDLVKKAQADKPQIQRLADQISGIFVPAVLTIATLTFLLSYFVFDISLQAAIIHSVAVLVISCPCAMGLATPTAVVVGIGRATKKGILIKGGRTLEELQTVKQVVFDKTGTLTTGKFRVSAMNCEPGMEKEVKSIITGLEWHSSHPIAKSLLEEFAPVLPKSLREVEEIKGKGLTGKDIQGNIYQVGSARMVEGTALGHALYVWKNAELIATLDLEDDLNPGAKQLIDYLKAQKITPIMLSGDRKEKCEEIAARLGIEQVYSEQLPQQKLEVIESLTASSPTAMVGDGINDAPALARATVGISLGGATDVAIESAQVVLLKGNLASLEDLWKIGKHTVLTIRQNLFWAFCYNIIAIPIAAFGFLSPIVSAAAMAFSDVMVIGNSLRLKVKRV